jgi:hypothetical protein
MDPIITASAVVSGTITGTLPISSYFQYFQPIEVRTPEITSTIGLTISTNILDMFELAGPYGATIVEWATGNSVVVNFMALGMGFVCVVFVINFVMRRLKLGKAYQDDLSVIVKRAFYDDALARRTSRRGEE